MRYKGLERILSKLKEKFKPELEFIFLEEDDPEPEPDPAKEQLIIRRVYGETV